MKSLKNNPNKSSYHKTILIFTNTYTKTWFWRIKPQFKHEAFCTSFQCTVNQHLFMTTSFRRLRRYTGWLRLIFAIKMCINWKRDTYIWGLVRCEKRSRQVCSCIPHENILHSNKSWLTVLHIHTIWLIPNWNFMFIASQVTIE